MAQSFDVVVIGGGPGGYVAAIRAAQLGFKTACIDEWKRNGKPSLGGTCLNVGCIPSKALLQSSENYEKLLHEYAEHGIEVDGSAIKLDVAKMLARKDKVVNTMTGGIGMLFMKNKIASLHGHGKFLGKNGDKFQIEVSDGEQKEVVEATQVILATGSVPSKLDDFPVDNQLICDNEGGLALPAVPKRLGVIGIGVIGLELGSVWRRLGAEVTCIKPREGFLREVDEEIAKEARKLFEKQGLKFRMGLQFKSVTKNADSVSVAIENADGSQETLEFDRIIVATGRSPNTQNLGLDSIGVKVNERGFIEVDDDCRTHAANVWAIGDVVRGPMLAHKASEEGVAVAERMAGQHPHFDFNTVPWVIYTAPEIAWVGKTEQQLKKDGIAYKKGKFPFVGNGRAHGMGETHGFVKMLACAKTDKILGVHLIGPFVSELVAEAVVAMEFGASSEDIARIIHAHPSLSEVMHEAALGCDKRAIHN